MTNQTPICIKDKCLEAAERGFDYCRLHQIECDNEADAVAASIRDNMPNHRMSDERLAEITEKSRDIFWWPTDAKEIISALKAERTENETLRARVSKYEKWFSDHASVLAVHGIGGFEFWEDNA